MKKQATPDSLYPRFLTVAIAVAVLIGLGYFIRWQPRVLQPVSSTGTVLTPHQAEALANVTVPTPQSNIVRDAKGNMIATFTVGARTVLMNGPSRTFSEPRATDATVTTTAWIRLYPTVFTGTVDKTWVDQMVALNNSGKTPDVLGTAMQYISGAPKIKDASGHIIAGDASFGPAGPDGVHIEGSDFNDFIGIPWTYGNTIDYPEPQQLGSLDCSGFQRMVWGYRSGLPLEQTSSGGGLSRRAYQILRSGPGVIIIPNNVKQVTDFSRMQIGDVAFLDVDADDGTQIDHMGIYFGVDSQGHHRFFSSRKTANGPTFGDIDGKAILDGNGYFAQRFRAVRRF